MEYLLHILILAALYAIVATSLNLVAGMGGFLSVAQAALFGVGAYASSLAMVDAGLPFAGGLVTAGAISAVVSLGVAAPALRIHDDYFVIVTFAFQVVVFSILNNWVDLTGGPLGLPGIPPPSLFGIRFNTRPQFFVLALLALGLAVALAWRISRSPFGRVLRTIREDEVLAAAMGKDVVRCKVVVFVVSAVVASQAGALYASYISFVDPSSFTIMESVLVLAMVIVGGAGSVLGPVLGAVLLIAVPEVFRFVGMPAAIAFNVRQVLYGLVLVLFVAFRPQGLIGSYRLGRRNVADG